MAQQLRQWGPRFGYRGTTFGGFFRTASWTCNVDTSTVDVGVDGGDDAGTNATWAQATFNVRDSGPAPLAGGSASRPAQISSRSEDP